MTTVYPVYLIHLVKSIFSLTECFGALSVPHIETVNQYPESIGKSKTIFFVNDVNVILFYLFRIFNGSYDLEFIVQY